MTARLLEEVRGLLAFAEEAFPPEDRVTLRELQDRLDDPLRIIIAGRLKAGKSTLLNALVGEELATTDAGESTRIVTWYRKGPYYRATIFAASGEPMRVMLPRGRVPLAAHERSLNHAEVRRIVVEWPSEALAAMTLIDTPGLDSTSAGMSQRTMRLVHEDAEPVPEADAVLYLLQHLHPSDVAFLEAFHVLSAAPSHLPGNAVGVLSRADEIAPGRPDSMDVAERVAGRHMRHATIRRLCQTVVPVAGLLAQGGATLTEAQFRVLAQAAAEPADLLSYRLASVDRFTADDASPVPAKARHDLLAQMGLFGVRLSIDLIRRGKTRSATDLAREMLARSGIDQLRRTVAEELGARQEVLKARTALLGLERLLRQRRPAGADAITAAMERLRAGAHEFAEASTLVELRSGIFPFDREATVDAEQLLGGRGSSAHARLGVPEDHPEDELRGLAHAAVARWRRRAEHPLAAPTEVQAARVVVRSAEGILSTLTP